MSFSQKEPSANPCPWVELQTKIGAGSYGTVFKALDSRDGTLVAVKTLHASGAHVEQLRKEIQILKQCNSPHIVAYKGAFQKLNQLWIVMEVTKAGGTRVGMTNGRWSTHAR